MRCRHCGVEIAPSEHRRGRWYGVNDGRAGAFRCAGGVEYHEPAVEPSAVYGVESVNVGRLDINVGKTCGFCRRTIRRGQPSDRVMHRGSVVIRHIGCEYRPPPPQTIKWATYNNPVWTNATTSLTTTGGWHWTQ